MLGVLAILTLVSCRERSIISLFLLVFTLLCCWLAYTFAMPGRLYLELTPKGFIERSPFMTQRASWPDIACFLVRENEKGRVVAFRHSENHPSSLIRRIIRDLTGQDYDGNLVLDYERSPQALADLLESWRLRYGSKPVVIHNLQDDALS
jgi:hypothetical protein